MQYLRWSLGFALCSYVLNAATFGTVVPVLGGASDLVLDESRGRLYLVNTVQNRIEVYSISQRRLLTPIATDSTPISAAISRSQKYLYVTSLSASALDIIDLDASSLTAHIALPAQPEGVGVGADERVLISTIGTAGSTNSLLIYNPNSTGATSLSAVPVPPAPPLPPSLPAPSQRQFLATRSQLTPTPDGSLIIGANMSSGTARVVFVYEVGSGTILRTRLVSNASAVVTVAPDGSKFMSGSTLFDTATLQVLAQENLANSPYLIATNANFNTQSVQGGSIFAPDGSVLYAAFNTSPQTNPATSPKVSEFMFNDPDNLLIQMALQLPENLAGKMVISSDGANVYALSDSGFTIIPVSTTFQNPIAKPDSSVLMLTYDQCGVNATQTTGRVNVQNAGRGRMTATAQVIQVTPTGPTGVAGGGAGGGIIGGGGVIIILPPIAPGVPTTGATNASIFQTAPPLRVTQTGNGATMDFGFNSLAARALGTISPSHDFAVQSPEAINVPPRIRVYQNNRDAESRGKVIPVPVGISANEALVDMVYDSGRQRLYIANSGMNRVEVFDIRRQQFLAGIKVGQLPRSLALTPDGNTLYVVNTGGENISIVDPDQLQTIGKVKFPPVPLNLTQVISTPSIIAAGLRGPIFMMTTAAANGTSSNTIWQIIGDTAVPRSVSAVIGSATVTGPLFMTNTPGGEYVLVASTNGTVYLYDALADDFVQSRLLTSANASTGYFGPLTAGPKGQYYIINGTILNSALSAVNPPASVPAGTTATPTRPIAALTSTSATTFARFTQPVRTSTTALPSDAGLIEIADAATGNVVRSFSALEGPMSQALATGRATTIDGRTMALDASGSAAYVITTSGLSIVPLTANSAQSPRVFSKGAVNLGSYQTAVAQNGLLSIFGTGLAATGVAPTTPLPYILGNTCVTLSNNPLPLFYTSDGQINAQIPPELASGNYSMIVRALDRNTASPAQTVTVSKFAPAVLVSGSGQPAILHADGKYVNHDNPANRDEPLTMYAVGLGLTTGGKVTGANPSPSSPLAVTGKVQVFFGDPTYTQAEIIVDWSGLTPGFIGLYQLNIRVPGFHMKGDALPVTLRINNVNSPSSGPVVPVVAVN